MHKIFSILVLVALASCTTIDEKLLAKYKKNLNQKYPPVSLNINKKYIFTNSGFIGSTAYYYRDKTAKYIYRAFKKSKNFRKVYFNRIETPFVVEINTRRVMHNRENYFWKLVLQIFTLALVPIDTEYTFYADVAIRMDGQIIKSYQYSTDVTDSSAIYYSQQGYKAVAMNILMSRFFKDLEGNNYFTRDR